MRKKFQRVQVEKQRVEKRLEERSDKTSEDEKR